MESHQNQSQITRNGGTQHKQLEVLKELGELHPISDLLNWLEPAGWLGKLGPEAEFLVSILTLNSTLSTVIQPSNFDTRHFPASNLEYVADFKIVPFLSVT